MKLCTQRERKKYPEGFVERLTKTLQRQKVLILEHRHHLISILIGNLLPDIKQIEENVVGWAGQSLDIIQAATQFFEALKATVFVLQIFTKPEIQL